MNIVELVEDDFENNRGIVQKWMKKIPEQNYSLVCYSLRADNFAESHQIIILTP
jgi:hypothetical protein